MAGVARAVQAGLRLGISGEPGRSLVCGLYDLSPADHELDCRSGDLAVITRFFETLDSVGGLQPLCGRKTERHIGVFVVHTHVRGPMVVRADPGDPPIVFGADPGVIGGRMLVVAGVAAQDRLSVRAGPGTSRGLDLIGRRHRFDSGFVSARVGGDPAGVVCPQHESGDPGQYMSNTGNAVDHHIGGRIGLGDAKGMVGSLGEGGGHADLGGLDLVWKPCDPRFAEWIDCPVELA